jgi:dethiobiotin synthetase
MQSIVVTGTGTDVGKTLLAAAIMSCHPAYSYWKPIQAGSLSDTDSMTVQRLSGCSGDRILEESYRFRAAVSPHLASSLECVPIDANNLIPPSGHPLVIEGAGGLMVPIDQQVLFIDLFAKWSLPVLIAARSDLGTINHTLLTIQALRNRNIPMIGVVVVGRLNPENEWAIEHYSGVPVLGRLITEPPITQDSLPTRYMTECIRLRETLLA